MTWPGVKRVGDHWVLRHSDRLMCRVCGEFPARFGIHCRRCWLSLQEERMDRE